MIGNKLRQKIQKAKSLRAIAGIFCERGGRSGRPDGDQRSVRIGLGMLKLVDRILGNPNPRIACLEDRIGIWN
ncbi:hypothetical protein TorRG33x02_066370 [Trema orientale]|uniref:Uncharacterized protein n=1 Tax=Trema orientale TaxID=63057 RepID=A0A2P5FIY1_TREOI|nr:hypothetical protein TorRG33x02_066370 [Trema orientale]